MALPPRIFRAGEEPVGVRVTSYHKPGGLRLILDTLDEAEVNVIKSSPFGKFIELADQTPYSGRVGRYMLSRQLKVSKKYEAWFIFAENPIRFSLREFAIVTGLPCGKYPSHPPKDMKKLINEQPYYNSLFGMLKEVSVSSVINMLKRKTVASSETRIKYALLAMLAWVILPTTHSAKISVEHAERIKNLDEFFAYPWGRLSFQMLISSIKEKDEVTLTQSTIALPGYVQALQMVMTKAVPALTEVVRQDSGEDEDFSLTPPRNGIKPAHARTLDAGKNVAVSPIIPNDLDVEVDEAELSFSDDEDDERVDKLVSLINEGSRFMNQMFEGGASKEDIARMREASEAAALAKKKKKRKIATQTTSHARAEPEEAVSFDQDKFKGDITRLEDKVDGLRDSVIQTQELLKKHMSEISEQFTVVQHCYQRILDSLVPPAPKENYTTCDGNQSNTSEECDPNGHTQTNPHLPSMPADPSDIINLVVANVQKSHGVDNNKGAGPPTENQPTHEDDHVEDLLTSKEDLNNNQTHSSPITTNVQDGITPPVAEVSLGAAQPAANQSSNEDAHVEDVVICDEDLHDDQPHLIPNTTNEQEEDGSIPMEEDHFPSFSLGLSQDDQRSEEQTIQPTDENLDNHTDVIEEPLISIPDPQTNAPNPTRKSTRVKTVSKLLTGVYQCDKLKPNRIRQRDTLALNNDDTIDYPSKFSKLVAALKTTKTITVSDLTISTKDLLDIHWRTRPVSAKMFDALMHHARFASKPQPSPHQCPVFLDTKFVSILSKNYTRFSKTTSKEDFVFTPNLMESVANVGAPVGCAERIYFPFNLDQTHWVGLCVDCTSWKLIVLDCNTSLRSDSLMAKELKPISLMFPYLLRRAGKSLSSQGLNPLTLERTRTVPQNPRSVDSGVTAALLIEGHAIGGIEACKWLNADVMAREAQRLAVTIYEDNVGPI